MLAYIKVKILFICLTKIVASYKQRVTEMIFLASFIEKKPFKTEKYHAATS